MKRSTCVGPLDESDLSGIMRHGGCRRVLNQSGADLSMAKQILGNRDLKTVMVYAQRDTQALTQFAQRAWEQSQERVATNGCGEISNHNKDNEINDL